MEAVEGVGDLLPSFSPPGGVPAAAASLSADRPPSRISEIDETRASDLEAPSLSPTTTLGAGELLDKDQLEDAKEEVEETKEPEPSPTMAPALGDPTPPQYSGTSEQEAGKRPQLEPHPPLTDPPPTRSESMVCGGFGLPFCF
mmetsp:Transcript_12725/g.36893  ORF Transcript_12725/g.36893 Transcript_12725/m.36893 type:complete len:143 (+) Transcript_12725:681-1109(+)